jgi:hypothetical protein
MASLDTLPADQRAVLQLVLQRGRSYDEIAQVLSIDSTAVRERALSALEALGPGTRLPRERREEISDYLLGQLSPGAAERARERIAQSPAERAWARVVSSELAPLAATPLPEIPVQAPPPAAAQAPAAASPVEPDAAASPGGAEASARPAESEAVVPPSEPVAAFAAAETPTAAGAEAPTRTGLEPPEPRPSSRRGGAVLLAAGALVAVAVVVVVIILVANSGGSKHKNAAANSTATSPSAVSSTTSTSSAATARPIAQVNLVSPTHSKKIVGVAEIIKQGTKTGLVIVAQGIPANTTHDAYAVWLYNSQTDNHILGFVNPGVKSNGKLQTAGPLPANARHFKQLLVTLETQAKPHGPGKVVLEGPLNITQ